MGPKLGSLASFPSVSEAGRTGGAPGSPTLTTGSGVQPGQTPTELTSVAKGFGVIAPSLAEWTKAISLRIDLETPH